MTAYASQVESFQGSSGEIEISLEIKTVNSKFLDLQIRSPRIYNSLDQRIAKLIRSRLSRGRVDVFINRSVNEGRALEVNVNLEQARALREAYQKVLDDNQMLSAVQLSELLQMPDWLHTKEVRVDADEEYEHLQKLLHNTLDQIIFVREQEGEAMLEAISKHRQEFEKIYLQIAHQSSKLIKDLRDRLRQRVIELSGDNNLDPQRLEQEVVFWVARSDFQEEVDRINHHLKTFDSILEKGGELGRRIEFLLQEMHRELNTLGSKCVDPRQTSNIIELKALVERIREQIQNIV